MSKTRSLDCADVLAMVRLLSQCRELGDGPVLWRQHFCRGLGQLVHANAVYSAQLRGCTTLAAEAHGAAAWAASREKDAAVFTGIATLEDGVSIECWHAVWSGAQKQANRRPPCDPVFPLTTPLDRAFDQPKTPLALFGSLCTVGETEFEGLIVAWHSGRAHADHRACLLIEMLHTEVAQLVGGPLARPDEPAPSQLPLRVQQVLAHLLQGESDRQISIHLNLSLHTVRQYTKQIYRFFNAEGRIDLLARWVRRGWGSKADWRLAVDSRDSGKGNAQNERVTLDKCVPLP